MKRMNKAALFEDLLFSERKGRNLQKPVGCRFILGIYLCVQINKGLVLLRFLLNPTNIFLLDRLNIFLAERMNVFLNEVNSLHVFFSSKKSQNSNLFRKRGDSNI